MSSSTIERVRSIMEHGTSEQTQSMRQELIEPEARASTIYEQVKLKKELQSSRRHTMGSYDSIVKELAIDEQCWLEQIRMKDGIFLHVSHDAPER